MVVDVESGILPMEGMPGMGGDIGVANALEGSMSISSQINSILVSARPMIKVATQLSARRMIPVQISQCPFDRRVVFCEPS